MIDLAELFMPCRKERSSCNRLTPQPPAAFDYLFDRFPLDRHRPYENIIGPGYVFISQVLHIDKLLPLERVASTGTTIDYLYEPSPEEILRNLLPRHIEFQIYRTLLDSAAAEQGARMTAMEGATKNAGEMIDSLTLTYNRIRQAAITKEIIEIVSGAAALD